MAVVVKKQKLGKMDAEFVYIKDAIAYFASVQSPKDKYVPEGVPKGSAGKEYSVTLFIDQADADVLDEIGLNKTLAKVGKDKNKKRKIRFPLSDQVEEGKFNYDEVKGKIGVTFSAPDKNKKTGKPITVTVIDKDGKPFEELVGNGSVVTVKLFGYRNQDDLLNTRLDVVQVREHVPYEGGGGGGGGGAEIEDDELGVTYTRSTKREEESPAKSDEDDVPFDYD